MTAAGLAPGSPRALCPRRPPTGLESSGSHVVASAAVMSSAWNSFPQTCQNFARMTLSIVHPPPAPPISRLRAAVLTTGTGTKTAFPAVLEGVPAGPRTRLSGRRRDVDRVSLSRTRGHVSFTLTRAPLRSRMEKHPSGVLIDFVGTHPQSSFQSNHFLTLHLVKTLCANDTFRIVTCHYVFVQTHRRCHTEREP